VDKVGRAPWCSGELQGIRLRQELYDLGATLRCAARHISVHAHEAP
jgi:hypothetical protein